MANVHRFSVADYHRLGEAGLLTTDDRVELLDGLIVEKPVQKPPHAVSLMRLQKRLSRIVPETFEARFQLPITLSRSEPEPDAVIAIGPEDRYSTAHPSSKDVALVVEVSDTSLDLDQGPKQRLYAMARLPVYWIVNIPDERVEVYTQPRGGKALMYLTRVAYPRGAKVPLVLNGELVAELAVSELLP